MSVAACPSIDERLARSVLWAEGDEVQAAITFFERHDPVTLDEVRRAAERQVEVFDQFSIEPEEFHEHGDRVAVSVRQRARGGASGAEVEIRIGHLWTVRGRKAVSLEVFRAPDDAHRAAALAEGR